MLHGRSNISAPLSQPPQPAIAVPTSAVIRSDLDVPVLTFEAETDLTYLGYFTARQPDSARFRLWEVAGTAHADTYSLVIGSTDLGNSPDVANLVLTLPGLPCAPFPSIRGRAFNDATDEAVEAGFVLSPDAMLMKAAAAASDIGK